jgi:type I restriction enzyme M protein
MEKNMSSFEEIKRVVFHAVDRLSLDVAVRDNSMMIFLLFLRDLGLIGFKQSEINNYLPTELVDKSIQEYQGENKDVLNKVCDSFADDFHRINQSTLKEIFYLLMGIDEQSFNKYYSKLVDSVIYSLSKKGGRSSNEYLQPNEITKLISKLAGKNIKTVYNPFAGIGSYGVEMNIRSGYFAQEINQRTWSIGVIRLLAHNIEIDNFLCQDSVSIWEAKNQKNDIQKSSFDLIVATPPFGVPIKDESLWVEPFKQSCKVEDYFLHHGINGLNEYGKLIGLFTPSILSNEGATRIIRKHIVNREYLRMVISLPSNLFYNSTVAPVVLVLSKSKSDQGFVHFIDGTARFNKQGRLNVFDYESLLSSIENIDSDYVKIVSTEQIVENDYNLTVGRYFQSNVNDLVIPEGTKLIKLGKLAEVFHGKRVINQNGKIVKVGDLSDSAEIYEKKATDFEVGLVTAAYQKIQSSVLLLSKIRTLKPTFCSASISEPVFCNNNIIALQVDDTQVDVRYLVLELHSERVKNFVNSKFSGVTIPSISIKDILEIPILLPSLEEQRSKFEGFLEAIVIKKKEDLNSFSKIHGLESDIHEQNTFLRHTLAGPVSNLEGTVQNIQSIIESYAKQVPEIWNMKVSDKHKFTLKEYVSNLSRDIIKISNTIGKQLKKESSLTDNPKELIDILSFLKSFVEEFNENKPQDYTLKFDFDENYFDLFEAYDNGIVFNPKVNANRNLLTDLLNNLIDNAVKHAFMDGGNNRIEILLLGVDEDESKNPKIQILFSNTGKPLPENFTIDDFSRKGNAVGTNSGDGFGGWYITEIIKYFGGFIDLIDETGAEGLPDSDLATSFEINLPVVYEEKL